MFYILIWALRINTSSFFTCLLDWIIFGVFFYEGAQRWEDICKGKLCLSVDYDNFFYQITGTDTVWVCHTAWFCWFKLGWVCRFRKHHTAMSVGGIQHQKHTPGQLYTEGTHTHTHTRILEQLRNEDAHRDFEIVAPFVLRPHALNIVSFRLFVS